MLSINKQIKNILRQILESEDAEITINGNKCYELLNQQFIIDPTRPIISFSNRPFNWKYFLGEIVWYLKRTNDPKFISNFSKFWNGLKNPDGTVNSNYGYQLFGENPYNQQLYWALEQLKSDQFTRKAVCFVSKPNYQYPNNKDFICTMYCNFWIRKNELHMKVNMRSNDIFWGATYDIPFFSLIMQSMRLLLLPYYPNLILGKYIHQMDNVHFYQRHLDIAKKICYNDETEEINNFIALKMPLLKEYEDKISVSPQTENLITSTELIIEKYGDINNIEVVKDLIKLFLLVQ